MLAGGAWAWGSPAAPSPWAWLTCRAGIEQGKQGTALGIFGAGNVGAALTKFVAPFVMVAYGWQSVAQVWAVGLAVMAVVFWFMTDEDPVIARTPRALARRPPAPGSNSSR